MKELIINGDLDILPILEDIEMDLGFKDCNCAETKLEQLIEVIKNTK